MGRLEVVLILSGGLDSATLLYDLLSRGLHVACLSFDYGQRHARELEAARAIALEAGVVVHRVVPMRFLAGLLGGSALTDLEVDVPEGHYAEETMKATVVPNRNMIMLSIAAGWAISRGSVAVAFGAHAGDHTIYPDCRPEFARAVKLAINEGNWAKIDVMAPFISLSKGDIVARGIDLDVPYRLTWTCYVGGESPCGKCGSCVERREAFSINGVEDPLC